MRFGSHDVLIKFDTVDDVRREKVRFCNGIYERKWMGKTINKIDLW